MSKTLTESLKSTFKDIKVSVLEESRIAVTAEPSSVLTVLKFLKDAGFDHLALVSAVDWIDDDVIELCFILTCYEADGEHADSLKLHVILKTPLPRKQPSIKTSIGVFPNAEPYEREIHELFGVVFEGHPRLIPLFLERDYKIPPFRKDFDTRKYVEEVFDSIPPIETDSK